MDDVSNGCAVDPHSKGDRRRHDRCPAGHPTVLGALPNCILQPCMVGQALEARQPRYLLRKLFTILPLEAIYDATALVLGAVFVLALDKRNQIRQRPVPASASASASASALQQRLIPHLVADVLPVETTHDNLRRRRQIQNALNIRNNLRSCRSSRSQDRNLREGCTAPAAQNTSGIMLVQWCGGCSHYACSHRSPQQFVLGAEIVAPRGDAVCLIEGEKAESTLAVERKQGASDRVGGYLLGAQVHHFVGSHVRRHLLVLGACLCRRNHRRTDPQTRELGYLVEHE